MPSKFVQISDYKSQEEKLSIHIAVDRINSSRINCMNGQIYRPTRSIFYLLYWILSSIIPNNNITLYTNLVKLPLLR